MGMLALAIPTIDVETEFTLLLAGADSACRAHRLERSGLERGNGRGHKDEGNMKSLRVHRNLPLLNAWKQA
jgi:hypothetical protein